MDRQDPSSSTFEQFYRCYPVAFLDKPHLEKGNKVIMPPSALERLASLHIDYPMLFELHNPSIERVTHCGVLEFVAEEGLIYLPYWLRNASLEKGTYVKLQPHSTDFLDVSNPKAILETSLRNYSCLTTGDTILVAYNDKKYYINIVETKPSAAVSVVETDFLEEEPPLKKFNAFTGSSRRLDGKQLAELAESTTSSVVKQPQREGKENSNDSKSSLASASVQQSGKLIFGANQKRPRERDETTNIPAKKRSQEPEKGEQEPKFHAFTGKKYTLKD
ncbi:unnamed protein product [Linum tenue]|uniref:Ubiquitin fusion degradation protein UFD1 N-terminal subdomain 1 domain-containing protein n=1 Tax=Linum tenue TaxID=586396 RepID=A0AAV0I6X7_9ROSI|nr:unnamed protein product [Linum tenue]